ncbi:MAG TPA: hypothetical protein DIW27_09100 [Cytophagales bacterium]|nr:hypothetical protein [Cytophagales bacterium]
MSIVITTIGCDTASTIDPPDESFFLKFYGEEGNQKGVDAVLNADGTITLYGSTEARDVTGKKVKQLYLVNIQQNGQLVWQRIIDTGKNTTAKDIELTTDGRLVIVGDVENTPTERDIIIMTLSLDGSEISRALIAYDTVGQPTDETANSVTQTNDGFIVVGSTSNLELKPIKGTTNDIRDALHVRFNDDLTIYPSTWRRAHGPGDFDAGVQIIQISPTQFYFFSYTNTQTGDFNYSILGLGVDGETNSPDSFLPGIPGSNEILSSVIISPVQSGEGYVLTGITNTTSSTATDLFIVKLRKSLTFGATDYQFQKSFSVNLGTLKNVRTSAFALASSGFLILTNENSTGVQKFYLTKITNDGTLAWASPIIYGGEKDSSIGSVLELPDGSIGMVGTFSVGEDGETKMVFIKVNKEGKFSK